MLPVSAMAFVESGYVIGGEGASGGVSMLCANIELLECCCCSCAALVVVDSLGSLAVPLPYFFGPQILLDPSFLSLRVASS